MTNIVKYFWYVFYLIQTKQYPRTRDLVTFLQNHFHCLSEISVKVSFYDFQQGNAYCKKGYSYASCNVIHC